MNSEKLAKQIARILKEKQGSDIVIQDLRAVTTMTDFFVLCTVQADVQAQAQVQTIEKEMKSQGIRLWHKEGRSGDPWILMDYVDVVVHIFKEQAREFYGLERMWGDAQFMEIKDDDES
ncbi:MAG: ribosome silencing factor [candidate division KSB1 bacterium]|nr:ribosome silencing factor [candidate division KSB1 bacterium]